MFSIDDSHLNDTENKNNVINLGEIASETGSH